MSNRLRALTILPCAIACASLPQLVLATPTQWEANGHYYEVVVSNRISWADADATAQSMGGYLATITSPEENAFITSLLPAGGAYHMGAVQAPGNSAAVGWGWVTGEPWSYTNWHSGEPNDWLHEEDASYIYGANVPYRNPVPGFWADVSHDMTAEGFVLERVPEPASLLTLLVGFALLKRKR